MASNENGTGEQPDQRKLRSWVRGHRTAKNETRMQELVAKQERNATERDAHGRHSRARAGGPTAHELTARLAAPMPHPQGSDVKGRHRKEER